MIFKAKEQLGHCWVTLSLLLPSLVLNLSLSIPKKACQQHVFLWGLNEAEREAPFSAGAAATTCVNTCWGTEHLKEFISVLISARLLMGVHNFGVDIDPLWAWISSSVKWDNQRGLAEHSRRGCMPRECKLSHLARGPSEPFMAVLVGIWATVAFKLGTAEDLAHLISFPSYLGKSLNSAVSTRHRLKSCPCCLIHDCPTLKLLISLLY